MKSAQQAASNWSASSGRAQQEWQAGIQGYSGDWAGATTRQQAAMLQGVQEAVTSGRWANGVNRVGTAGWKSATEAKSANYGTGFTAGASKFQSAIQKIVQAEQGIVSGLPPRGTYDQNMQRARAFSDAMHALKGQLGA